MGDRLETSVFTRPRKRDSSTPSQWTGLSRRFLPIDQSETAKSARSRLDRKPAQLPTGAEESDHRGNRRDGDDDEEEVGGSIVEGFGTVRT